MNGFRNTTKRMSGFMMGLILLTTTVMARAGDARTNASATGNAFGPGTATAGASSGGGQGYARTDTRSGDVNFASGVAMGIDQRGVSFSASNALAGRLGPAFASSFNISIGLDGSVATSGGLSTAIGGLTRTVSASGFTGNTPHGAIAGSTVGGRSDPRGFVSGRTWSHSTPQRGWRR